MWVDLSGGEGRLIGFSNQATGSSSRYDRHLYLDNTGHVRFGIWTGGATTVTSDAAVTGGRHHIAATLGAAGMRLYVDGVLQSDQNPAVTQGEQGYTGYWRIGWDNLGLLARAEHRHLGPGRHPRRGRHLGLPADPRPGRHPGERQPRLSHDPAQCPLAPLLVVLLATHPCDGGAGQSRQNAVRLTVRTPSLRA